MSFLLRLIPWRCFVARSDAMRPSIFAGDVLVVRRPRRRGGDYDVGDVIAYDSAYPGMSPSVRRICMMMHPANGITQYVVRRDADGVVTDAVVEATHVIGEVRARLVNVGRVVDAGVHRSSRSISRLAAAPNARRSASAAEMTDINIHTTSATDSAAE